MRRSSFVLFCFFSLFSLFSLSEVRGEESSCPSPTPPSSPCTLVLFTPKISQKELRPKLLPTPLNTAKSKAPLFFSAYYAPPHEEMQKRALQTGRHALFSSVYSDFVAHHAPALEEEQKTLTWLSFSPRFCWQSLSYLGAYVSRLSAETSSPEKKACPPPLLWIGKDFVFLWYPTLASSLPKREEKRAISPEDLGFSLKVLAQNPNYRSNSPSLQDKTPSDPSFDLPTGRFIFTQKPWSALATHQGTWQPRLPPDDMKFNGALVLGEDFIWENGLTWNNAPLPENDPALLKRIFTQTAFYSQWWQKALKVLSSPPCYTLKENEPLVLSYNQWQPSWMMPSKTSAPLEGDERWDYALWEKTAKELREIPFAKSTKGALNNNSGGIGGFWNLTVEKEGHYEIIARFSALNPHEKSSFALQEGEAFVRCGQVLGSMKILKGATEFSLGLDLFAGKQQLEIDLKQRYGNEPPSPSESKTPAEANSYFLSPPFVILRYKGPRKNPHIKFQG